MSENYALLLNTVLPQVYQLKESRFKILDSIAKEVIIAIQQDGIANLVFVCTHNSRRSQIAQLSLQLFLQEVGIDKVKVFSCGTEKTHIPTQTQSLFKSLGLNLDNQNDGSIIIDGKITLFSKTHEYPSLPQRSIAIMVCDHASESCPFVPGFNKRISLEYTDPKGADGTAEEEKSYRKCWNKIATEMAYLSLKLDELIGK
ncbi:MAG TPA: hypothetical protein PLY70_17430 [Saprospiraceae bacterium]|nr:hypothetical protein [Saprospiraceae bacterium]HPN68265.1 hypothetical protein [Saprospiraceae bacterium]